MGQDAAHGRPNAVAAFGLDGAVRRLETLAGLAVASIPPCPRAGDLRALILMEARRLLPHQLAARAA